MIFFKSRLLETAFFMVSPTGRELNEAADSQIGSANLQQLRYSIKKGQIWLDVLGVVLK